MTIKSITSILLSLNGLSACQQHVKQPQPNIVFFLADDMGFETLKAYGGNSYDTPNLDKLSAEGMTFNYCYANEKIGIKKISELELWE